MFLLVEHEVNQRPKMVLFSSLELHLVVCVFGPKPCFLLDSSSSIKDIHVKFQMCLEEDDDMVTSL